MRLAHPRARIPRLDTGVACRQLIGGALWSQTMSRRMLAGAALAYHSWRNRRRRSADAEDSRVPLLTTGRQ